MSSIVKVLGGVLPRLLFSGKKKAGPAPLPEASRDVAAEQQAIDDELLRRKGSIADIMTGTRGAEAAASQVGKLVVGN